MKKLFGTMMAASFCLVQYGTQAQASDHASLLNLTAISADPAAVKASRDFLRRVGDQKEEQWYKLERGYEAAYREGPVKGLYYYDNKGRWVYSILSYGEDRLPEGVRHLVRSTWYDFGISWVKEVKEAQDLVYVVHIENDKAWKEVAVQDGEMRVLKEFCK